jgi:hypothetical protein
LALAAVTLRGCRETSARRRLHLSASLPILYPLIGWLIGWLIGLIGIA